MIIKSFNVDEMDSLDRNNVNFILNLCYLYDIYGVELAEEMLSDLGTNVTDTFEI